MGQGGNTLVVRSGTLLAVAFLMAGTALGDVKDQRSSESSGVLLLNTVESIRASTVDVGFGRKLLNSLGFVFAPDVVAASLPYYAYSPKAIMNANACDAQSPVYRYTVGSTLAVLRPDLGAAAPNDMYVGWLLESPGRSKSTTATITFQELCNALGDEDNRSYLESQLFGLVSPSNYLEAGDRYRLPPLARAQLLPENRIAGNATEAIARNLIPVGSGFIDNADASAPNAAGNTFMVNLGLSDHQEMPGFEQNVGCVWRVHRETRKGLSPTHYFAAVPPGDGFIEGVNQAESACPTFLGEVALRPSDRHGQNKTTRVQHLPITLYAPADSWLVVSDEPFPGVEAELRFDRTAFAEAGLM